MGCNRRGMQQGSMKVLVRQAAKRFNVKPDLVYAMLVGLKTEEIEELAARFLDAVNLDQIRGWAEEKRLARAQSNTVREKSRGMGENV